SGTAIEVYDITDPLYPERLTGIAPTLIASNELALAHAPGRPGRYIATTPAQLLAPEGITPDVPSQLRAPTEGADWIIITPQSFRSEAERLAAHRQLYQHYRTAVVDIQDIYDEFNGGVKDKEAIRAFLRYAYENWPRPAPRFVVLLGDGHYDPRYLLSSTNMIDHIPPYLAAVNPFDGIVAADNRYVAYDPVPPAKNPVPFMHLGRLPANTLADARAMVDKIIAYETAPAADWNLDVLFIADNADQGGNFPVNSDKVAEGSVLPSAYNRQKVYYQVNYANKTDANNAIIAAINDGALFVNYHGHASTQNWSSEPLLAQSDQARMTNAGMYPVFLPMTCLEGDFANPSGTLQSFGETVVRLPNAGAVASWSPTGKGVAQGHDVIYEAFYAAIFEHGITEIGPATTYAKQVMYNSTSLFKDLIDSYILFGDPAMPLALPSADLRLAKRAAPEGTLQQGQVITYTLQYSNRGMVIANGVILTDTLPAALTAPNWTASDPAVTALPGTTFTWQLPDLIPGASGLITVTATVAPDAPSGATITNMATISTTSYERPAHLPDNTATASGTIRPALYLLEGRTFTDANGNKSFDPPGDIPLATVPIEIRDSTGTVVAAVFSNSQGQWSVNLPAGVYTVVVPPTFNGQTLGVETEIQVVLGPGGPGGSMDIPYLAPTGLEIEYFRASRTAGGVRVEWATRVELIVEHFDVYRALDPAAAPDARVKVNQTPIPPRASLGEGATYEILATRAPAA
ncbi:MAG: C25 family cysteine peptidase, partial [Anaerolineae bacterium]|nr:C25 family cysteine peptidase [Anaerolineae bacterium]